MFFVKGMVSIILVKCCGRFPSFEDVHFISLETISNIWPLLSFDLKSTAMGIWGWWAIDIFTLMASYLGPNVVAT